MPSGAHARRRAHTALRRDRSTAAPIVTVACASGCVPGPIADAAADIGIVRPKRIPGVEATAARTTILPRSGRAPTA